MRALGTPGPGSSSTASSSSRHSARCNASGQQINRPSQLSQPLGRPQLPAQQQRQQQQQQQVQQPQQQLPLGAGPRHPGSSSSSSGVQAPGAPSNQLLLTPPSRHGLHPQQQQRRVSPKLDDSDTRMAAYDSLAVQVTCAAIVPPLRPSPSFNSGVCRVRPFMAAAMKAAHLQRPTPVQGHLMAAIRGGSDVLSAAPPGAGNSSGALLGLLNQLLGIPRSVPRTKAWPLALVLCPTRELALQQAAAAAKLVAGSHLTVKCVTGSTSLTHQALQLRRGVDVLVATPGRLMDLLGTKQVNLMRLKYMVLEEVDELTGPALLPVLKQLLHHTTMPHHQQRQTIALGSSALPQQQLLAAAVDVLQPSAVLLRATWPLALQQQQQQHPLPQQQQQQQPPQWVSPGDPALSGASAASFAALLADPTAALAAAAAATAAAIAPSISQRFLGVAPQVKQRALLRLLSTAGGGAAIGGTATNAAADGPSVVFTNSAAAADELCLQLAAAGVAAGALHYARSQNQREEALQCFKFGVTQVLVACGLAYRGLDLPDVSLVVHYEIPLSLAEYARRTGLAGRKGGPGASVTLITPGDGANVAPLVALLTITGQAVPDWLAALAAGSSGSSRSGMAAASMEATAAAAAAEAAVPDSSSSDSSPARSCQDEQQQQQQQQQPSSGIFTVAHRAVRLGGYKNAPPRSRTQA